MPLAPSFGNRLRPRPGLSSGRRAGHSRALPSWRGFLFWLNVGVGFVVVVPPPPLVTFFRDVLPVPSAPMQCACSELLLWVGISVTDRQRYQVIIVYDVASSLKSFSNTFADFSAFLFLFGAKSGGVFVSPSRLIQNKTRENVWTDRSKKSLCCCALALLLKQRHLQDICKTRREQLQGISPSWNEKNIVWQTRLYYWLMTLIIFP